MATITRVISATSSDHGTGLTVYSHPQAFADSLPANLVTDGNSYVGECYNDGEFDLTVSSSGVLLFPASTTDSTHFVTLKCAAGQSFYDNANKLTNALRYSASNGVAITSGSGFGSNMVDVSANYTVVDGLQIRDTYTSQLITLAANGTNSVLKNCLVYKTSANANVTSCILLFRSLSVAVNCLVIDDTPVSVNTNGIRCDTDDTFVINCGVVLTDGLAGTQSTRQGYVGNYSHPTVRNCWAIGYSAFSRHPGSTLDASSDYNATDNASANSPGTHNVTSLVLANTFVDITPSTFDARIKSGSALINAGTRDQTYTADLDIVKSSRSITTPTIGPWEFAGAAAATGQGDSYTMITS